MRVWKLRFLAVSYDFVYYVERRWACSQLVLRLPRSFDFLGTVHAMQRQHTSGRELFMNEEIETDLLAQAEFAGTS